MVRQPLALNFLKYNVRLFGNTVVAHGTPTVVYCDDHLRATLFEDRFRAFARAGSPPDAVGMTEFWDGSLVPAFQKPGFWEEYQFCHGPFGRGFPEIFEIMREKGSFLYPLISSNPDIVVRYFARSQLLEGVRAVSKPLATLFKAMEEIPLRPIKGRLVEMMKDRTFLGSGLFLLIRRRHKIVSHRFIPFESKKYGLDLYAQKGILHVVLELPDGQRLSVFLTHLHVGRTEEDRSARREQILQIKRLIEESPYPVILMGDLNIIAEEVDLKTGRLIPSEEYLWTVENLGLVDTFREFHKDPNKGPESRGYTYDDTTHFSKVLGIDALSGSRRHFQRIDYIFRDRHFETRFAQVSRDQMRHPRYGGRDLSDHFPVCATLVAEGG